MKKIHVVSQGFDLDLIKYINEEAHYDVDDLFEQVEGLLNINNANEIKGLFIRICNDENDAFEDLSAFLFRKAVELNKVDFCIKLYVDLVASLAFDDPDLVRDSRSTWSLNAAGMFKRFTESLVEECLDKRSHVKFFITLNSIFRSSSGERTQKFLLNVDQIEDKIKKMAFVSLNKENTANFKRVLNYISENDIVKNVAPDVELHHIPHAVNSEVFKKLDDEIIDVHRGMAIVIPPGVKHRALGRMKVLIVVLPEFDPQDEWVDDDVRATNAGD